MAAKDQGLIHREIARRSQDIHRVKNIMDEDYKLIWDGFVVATIPAGGTADLKTYELNKYLREVSNLILRKRQDSAIKEENERRSKRGEKEMDKWLGADQHVFEGKFAVEKGVANPQVVMELYKELYVGLVKEYGAEELEKEEKETIPTTHQQLMKELLASRKHVSNEPPIISKTPTTPLEQLKQPQLRKMAKDKGIDTKKTDKKQELIDKISQT